MSPAVPSHVAVLLTVPQARALIGASAMAEAEHEDDPHWLATEGRDPGPRDHRRRPRAGRRRRPRPLTRPPTWRTR